MKAKYNISNILKDMEDIMKVLAMFMHRSKNQMIINNKINPQFHRQLMLLNHNRKFKNKIYN